MKKTKYYKVINSNMGVPGIQMYSSGLNIANIFNIESKDGIYFTDIKHIFAYLNYGPFIAELYVPKDADIYRYDEDMGGNIVIPGWFSKKIVITMLYDKGNIDDIMYLIECGADISCCDYALIKYALIHNIYLFDMLKTRAFFNYHYHKNSDKTDNLSDAIDRVVKEYYGLGDNEE